MRVHFLTLRADNRPKTGKRQDERTRAPRREEKKEKICVVFSPPSEMHRAFRMHCNIETAEIVTIAVRIE
jgi:hypothetical protein